MSFLIINAIPNEIINDLNIKFNLHLAKNLTRILPTIALPDDIDKFEAMKRFMETDDEVAYDRNTY